MQTYTICRAARRMPCSKRLRRAECQCKFDYFPHHIHLCLKVRMSAVSQKGAPQTVSAYWYEMEMKYNGSAAQSRPALYATVLLSWSRPKPGMCALAGIVVQYIDAYRFAVSVSSAYTPGKLTSCFSTLASGVHWQHFVITKQLGDILLICTQHIIVECP